MRVLQINNFFYPRGGAEAVFFDTVAGLKMRGHEIIEFSTRDRRNLSSDYTSYFAPNFVELPSGSGLGRVAIAMYRRFTNREAQQNLRALILAVEPELAHLHNVYHYLPGGIFKILKQYRIPIVLTVHDVWSLCPDPRFLPSVADKLKSNFFSARLADAWEARYYRFKKVWQMVDNFICPSEFALSQLLRFGFSKNKLFLARNPLFLPPLPPPLGDKIVYLGRFHADKGIKTLLAALPWLRQYETIIAGHGPENRWMEDFIRQYSLTNVKKIGWVDKDHWGTLMSLAKVVVVPSLVYESSSRAMLEALAFGRLVVTVARGGVAETIQDGKTGFLVPPNDPEALARVLKTAMDTDVGTADEIAKSGRALLETEHKPDMYFTKLEEIYSNLINNLAKIS